MGNFYTNLTVRGSTQHEVAAKLAGRSAYVTPASNNSIVVFADEKAVFRQGGIEEWGAHLSRELGCPVLAVTNHDDDVLFYNLFRDGAQLDQYCSVPGYFSGEAGGPSGGDAKKLCASFDSSAVEEVQAILHPADGDLPVFAMEQHEALVRVLGLSDHAVGMGFSYIEHGELPGRLLKADLVRVE